MRILTDRLMAIANMVTPGFRLADIGCDHGYLAIYLVKNNIVPYVIAMDINKGPLERAGEHVTLAGLNRKIELRLSDGMNALKTDEVQSAVMAGMGGPLMISILTKGRDICNSLEEIILQPQSEIEKVRHFLEDNGYNIVEEDIVLEENKFYPMMKVKHGKMKLYRDVFYRYGRLMFDRNDPVFTAYLRKEKGQFLAVRDELLKAPDTQKVEIRLRELSRDISLVEEALAICVNKGA
ncbi:MAG: class I SAM-dependent methyltransferase [Lachnospiraceae bacterium]|nr:class I SAM-dependent methyltransferase [Lachnospiraceae bacterium]